VDWRDSQERNPSDSVSGSPRMAAFNARTAIEGRLGFCVKSMLLKWDKHTMMQAITSGDKISRRRSKEVTIGIHLLLLFLPRRRFSGR
jgi:hypothetical protein